MITRIGQFYYDKDGTWDHYWFRLFKINITGVLLKMYDRTDGRYITFYPTSIDKLTTAYTPMEYHVITIKKGEPNVKV